MPRRGHHEPELPFVALMDTMTNVVGVLIIVLVMIGIGLAKTVRKVLSELPPVTVEEHAQLQQEVAATMPKFDPKKVDEENAKLQQDLARASEELKTMDVTKEQQNIKIVDLAELQKQLAERKKERDLKKAATDQLLAELGKLKARLDTTPVYQPPPALVVRLPNPRPMPEKAEVQHFLITGSRIIFTNDEELAKLVEQEVKKVETTLGANREIVKGPDGKPAMQVDKFGHLSPQRKVTFDPKKLADYFAKMRLGSRDLAVELTPVPNSPYIPLKLSPVPNAGETAEQAKKLVSAYQTLLRKFKADSKAVLWFHVYKDSIETYLAARELADQAGVPVGWELYGAPYYIRYLPPEYTVEFTPPPPAPAGAAPVVTIAPPKATLD